MSKILAFEWHYLENSGTVSLSVWWYVNDNMFKNLYIWFLTVFTDTESLLVYTATQCSPLLKNSYWLIASHLWACIMVMKFASDGITSENVTWKITNFKANRRIRFTKSVTRGRQFTNECLKDKIFPSSFGDNLKFFTWPYCPKFKIPLKAKAFTILTCNKTVIIPKIVILKPRILYDLDRQLSKIRKS